MLNCNTCPLEAQAGTNNSQEHPLRKRKTRNSAWPIFLHPPDDWSHKTDHPVCVTCTKHNPEVNLWILAAVQGESSAPFENIQVDFTKLPKYNSKDRTRKTLPRGRTDLGPSLAHCVSLTWCTTHKSAGHCFHYEILYVRHPILKRLAYSKKVVRECS